MINNLCNIIEVRVRTVHQICPFSLGSTLQRKVRFVHADFVCDTFLSCRLVIFITFMFIVAILSTVLACSTVTVLFLGLRSSANLFIPVLLQGLNLNEKSLYANNTGLAAVYKNRRRAAAEILQTLISSQNNVSRDVEHRFAQL